MRFRGAVMSTELRDSLAADVTVGLDSAHNQESVEVAVADAILRSPEMQAIKVSLARFARYSYDVSTGTGDEADVTNHARMMLRRSGLPKHVTDWVLS